MILGIKEIQKLKPKILEWVYITYESSLPPYYDIYFEDSGVTASNADSIMEWFYPANNQNVGDLGVIYDGNQYYYILEAQ